MRTPFTLDDHDAYDDLPQTRSGRGGSKLELPVLAGNGCWCGDPQAYHDWPGKDEGKPHPR